MPYTPKYTTVNNIRLKLASRLNIISTPVPDDEFYPGINTRPAQSIVDSNLLELVLEEKESFLDMILDQIYVLPLRNSHPILREIVDNWVIAELMKIYYQGVGLSNVSNEIGNLANDLLARANYLVGTLCAGRDVFLPINHPNDNPVKRPLPFILKGEIQKPPEALVIGNTILHDVHDRNSSVRHMGIDFGDEIPHMKTAYSGRARGAMEPL